MWNIFLAKWIALNAAIVLLSCILQLRSEGLFETFWQRIAIGRSETVISGQFDCSIFRWRKRFFLVSKIEKNSLLAVNNECSAEEWLSGGSRL